MVGQPKTVADNQKLQPGSPWDNPFYFPNSDTGQGVYDAQILV